MMLKKAAYVFMPWLRARMSAMKCRPRAIEMSKTKKPVLWYASGTHTQEGSGER